MLNAIACRSSKFVWSRDLTKALIEEYEKYPALFEVSSMDYRRRDKKLQALKQIASDLNRTHLTALTEEEIKEKLHGIRTQYFQELRKVRKSKVTGSSTDGIYIPKLWCFDMLHFLGRGEPTSEGESNLGYETQPYEDNVEMEIQDIENRDPNEANIIFDGDVEEFNSSDIAITPLFSPVSNTSRRSSRSEPSRKKGKKEEKGILMENAQATLEMASMALQDLKDKDSSKNDNPISFEHRVFGNMVGMELDKIKNEEELDRLKMKITTLIYECKERCRTATRQQENLY